MSGDKTPRPCTTCPWKKENHGRRPPDFLIHDDDVDPFSEKNAKRLWHGIRKGEVMNCHRRDEGQGGKGNGQTVCYGSVGLVMAEMNLMADDQKAYRKSRGGYALTREGAMVWAGHFTFGRTGIISGAKIPRAVDSAGRLGVPGTPIEW